MMEAVPPQALSNSFPIGRIRRRRGGLQLHASAIRLPHDAPSRGDEGVHRRGGLPRAAGDVSAGLGIRGARARAARALLHTERGLGRRCKSLACVRVAASGEDRAEQAVAKEAEGSCWSTPAADKGKARRCAEEVGRDAIGRGAPRRKLTWPCLAYDGDYDDYDDYSDAYSQS